MFGNGFISVNWSGKWLTPEQELVTMKVAAHFLKSDRKRNFVDFTHELLDGRLIHQSQGLFVSLAGNFFRAELGEIDEVPWVHEFLLMNGAEDRLADNSATFARNLWRDGRIVDEIIADPKITRVTSASLLD